MIYQNTSQDAILAAERHRLGGYGGIWEEEEDKLCPYCEYRNPEEFFVGEHGCVGCSECIKRIDCEEYEL